MLLLALRNCMKNTGHCYQTANCYLQTYVQICCYLIKHINIDLLQTMRTTELIDLMMNLVIYPCLVILHAIVAQSLVHIFLTKPVNNLWKEHTNQHIHMVNVNLRFSLLLTRSILNLTSIFSKLIITPPLVPHGMSVTCSF